MKPYVLESSSAAEVNIGLIHSLSGAMQSRETPLLNAELIAIEEINAKGGLLGRMVAPSADLGGWPRALVGWNLDRSFTRARCVHVGVRKTRAIRVCVWGGDNATVAS